MAFTSIDRIKHIAETPEEAIRFYGEFVEIHDKLIKRNIDHRKRTGRCDWSSYALASARANQAVSVAQKAIADKFGFDVMYSAINAHPIK